MPARRPPPAGPPTWRRSAAGRAWARRSRWWQRSRGRSSAAAEAEATLSGWLVPVDDGTYALALRTRAAVLPTFAVAVGSVADGRVDAQGEPASGLVRLSVTARSSAAAVALVQQAAERSPEVLARTRLDRFYRLQWSEPRTTTPPDRLVMGVGLGGGAAVARRPGWSPRGSPPPPDRGAHVKVAHVIHSLGAGGAEAVLEHLAPAARAASVEIIVIGLSDAADNRTARRLREAGVTVHELHRGRYDLTAVLTLARLLRSARVDVVHTHLKHADVVGGLAAGLVGLPAVSTLHLIEAAPAGSAGRGPRPAGGCRPWPPDAHHHRAVPGPAPVVCRVGTARCGPDHRAQRRRRAGAPAHTGRGPRRARRPAGPGPRPDGLPDAPREGARRPARGAARHTAGRPPRGRARRRRPARSPDPRAGGRSTRCLRDRVRVLGFREDVDDLLAACDLVIHPSRADALPTALVSAIASRRAVVATDVGGIADIVGDGVGDLVPSGLPQALAAAVTALVADPRRRDERGDRGRARYEREFSATVWAGRLREVYVEAMQPPSQRDRGPPRQPRSCSPRLPVPPQPRRSP